ncbi:MAG: hypothetical protein DMG81_08415 [Acidobacteria bacterium]|nr:MAG: hypothetical protein DMG81_08415 [Acidobacteriota bacterium]
MIFGFNTDVKQGDTVYHVQSEARENELILQTQVFVRGRCIGKRATSSIREGRVENVLDRKDTQESLAAVKELDLQWVNADSVHSDTSLLMNLRVTEGGAAVEGARLTFRFARPDAAPFYTQVATNSAGYAEMKVEMQEASLPDASVLVQASFGGRTATRKFRLRKID